MPFKDPEKEREYRRQQMKNRRAKAKQTEAAQTSKSALPPADTSLPSPNSLPSPATQIKHPDQWPPIKADIEQHVGSLSGDSAVRDFRENQKSPLNDQPELLPDTESPEYFHLNRHNRWLDYPTGQGFEPPYDYEKDPGKQGFACIHAPGRCCFPLRYKPPRGNIDQCLFRPPNCIYYKSMENVVRLYGNFNQVLESKIPANIGG